MAIIWSSLVVHGTAQGLRDLGMYGVFAYRHWFNVLKRALDELGALWRSSVLYRCYPFAMLRRLVLEVSIRQSGHWNRCMQKLWRPRTLLAHSVV